MKSKSTILFMILTLLTNNIVLAAGSLLDQHECDPTSSNMAVHTDSGSGNTEHSDHAEHCCHIQAHFQTVLPSNSMFAMQSDRSRLFPRLIAHHNSLSDSPPTPPPKI